ncbi:cytochrome P450 9e2-like [Chelonus insularis]|uniref:cytochrome P450 9e2-like n=1 Tax=Chelonus insularis TaxID=460826 RepID=UPI00158D9693|nr:cytochrome P450 9e2-like [Chelonus insularis]
MELTTLLLVFLFLLIAYFFYSNINPFEKYGIPYIKPVPIFGNMATPMLCLTSFGEMVQKVYQFNPKARYVGFFDFNCPTVVIRDPELIKDISIKNFDNFVDHRGFVNPENDPLFGNNLFSLHGDKWREIRNLLSPSFTSSKMKGMFKLMSDCSKNFTDYWIEESKKGPVNIHSKNAFGRYTTDVIATCAFGITTDSMRNPKNEFYVLGSKSTSFQGLLAFKFFLLRSFPNICNFFKAKLIDSKVEKFFQKIIRETIQMREEKGISRSDMIQLMMETRNKTSQGTRLTIEEMTSQAFIFFFGGFDTTSILMSFVAHVIAANPTVQAKLRSEVDEIYKKSNGDPTYEMIKNMEYLDAIINETLRLYPIAPILDRICTKPFELPPALPGGKSFPLKKGDCVWFPAFGLHRDPAFFSDPDEFKPERFLVDSKSLLNSPAYLPFGIGPRICIGNRFALLETKILFFHLIAKCTLKTSHKMHLPLTLDKGVATSAKGGFWLVIEPRTL